MKAPSSSVRPQTAAATSQSHPQTPEGPGSINWNGWLETVRTLPPEAPDWEGLPQFLETLKQLYQNNQQTRLTCLQKALTNLTTQAGGRLTYFEMHDASQWTAETCLSTHITSVTQLSEQLLALLLQHDENDQQRPATYEEERSHRRVADELADKIGRIYGQLSELFALSPEQVSQQRKKEEEHQGAAEPPKTSSKPLSETLDEPPPLPQPEEFLPGEDQASSSRTETEPIDSRTDDPKPSAIPESAASAPTPPVLESLSRPEPPAVQTAREPIASEEETPQLVLDGHDEEDDKIRSALPQAGESLTKEVLLQDSPLPGSSPEDITQREVFSPSIFIKPEVSLSDILLPGTINADLQERAFRLQTSSDPEEWVSLLWDLIAEDALPTAYWLAQSLPAMDQPCPVPDWLLAAVQAARWLLPNSQSFVFDLTDIVQNAQSLQDEPQKLLSLSAALRATLLAPTTGIQTWLSVPESCPNLGKVIEPIKRFAAWRRALRPDDLRGSTIVEQRKEDLREATQKAKSWLEDAPKRRTTLKRASDVWLHMTASGGVLQTFLLPVAENEQGKCAEVRENLRQWQDKNSIINRINKIDQELAGKKYRRIDGKILNRIVQDVQKASDLARRWCECVEREQDLQTGDRFFQMADGVRSQIQEALPGVTQALQELSSPVQPRPIGAAAQCLLRSIEQLQDMFTGRHEPPTCQQEWFAGNADSLPTALGRLLLWLPEISQENAGQIGETAQSQVAPALCKAIAEGRSLESAFDTWLAIHDYRFAETILAAFDEADRPTKSQTYQEALEGAREGLRTAKSKTRAAIERAEVDGISAEERSEHEGIIESLDPDEILYFRPKHDQLNQINAQLEKARRIRLQEVRTSWDNLQPRLAERMDSTKWERIRSFVQSNLDSQEARVVEECIAHLTGVVEEGRGLEEDLFSPPRSRDVLQEFLNALPQLQESLQRMGLRRFGRNIDQGSSVASINFGKTSRTRRDEVAQAIKAWQDLKQRGVNGSNISGNVSALLSYLGFSLKSVPSIHPVSPGADWVYIRAQMSASGLAKPIPQFGSHTHDIVCVWERPGADTMSAWLRDLHLGAHNSVLVFYPGRLTDRQWHDFARRAQDKDQGLALAVLDETLLTFLAQERDARLPIFLRCALPFSAINPYTPAGHVPPEMFFGRDPMARELQQPSGSCLVYGGRQLGKSALLQHVRREFHHPEREQYAWVTDIKPLGDPRAGSKPEILWEKVRAGLQELELLRPRITTNKPEEIIGHIRKVMAERPERRVLMLFDEADNFLDADAKDQFQVVEGLRTLMLDTERRFKVIFAGLHNVQRFQGIPNQPLAQFGTPLLVGPLEPSAAQQLVCEPLEVLGYRFDDAGTVLRILSYTNYHPGLIQLFCHELLKRLQQRRTSPPYSIAQSDVEAVYRLPQVRDGIRDRFAWTLALDSRYEAIVWTMILDQKGSQDGYAQSYAPADLLQLAREWWPRGFARGDSDQLRGLLEEMTGLGVLVRYARGHYRLRSPNLVRLVGTETDIENRLIALWDKEPEEPFNADSHHVLLEGQRYSPLTHAQERRLNASRFGVGLVFASEALGLSHIEAAFQRFIPSDPLAAKGSCEEIPSTELDSTRLERWLRAYLASHKNSERLILWGSFRETNAALLETVKVAHKVCQAHQRSKKRWMRLLFVFDPGAAWNWLSLPRRQREEIEEQADVVTFPQRWNPLGIRQRLIQHDQMASDEVCRTVLETTGGWPRLLDILLKRGNAYDPRPAAQTLEQELREPDSQTSRGFKLSLGLHDTARTILESIKTTLQEDGQEVPIDLIAALEDIDGSPIFSQNECHSVIEYLRRMGCIDLRDDLLSIEPAVLRSI